MVETRRAASPSPPPRLILRYTPETRHAASLPRVYDWRPFPAAGAVRYPPPLAPRSSLSLDKSWYMNALPLTIPVKQYNAPIPSSGSGNHSVRCSRLG